jgi:hypothetical protein
MEGRPAGRYEQPAEISGSECARIALPEFLFGRGPSATTADTRHRPRFQPLWRKADLAHHRCKCVPPRSSRREGGTGWPWGSARGRGWLMSGGRLGAVALWR